MKYLPIILLLFLYSCGEQELPTKSVEEEKAPEPTTQTVETEKTAEPIEKPVVIEHENSKGEVHYSKTISSNELYKLGDTLTLDINPILNTNGMDMVGDFYFEENDQGKSMLYVELLPENWDIDKENTYDEQNCFYIYLETYISRKGKKIKLKQLQKLVTDFSYNCISDVGC